MTKIIQLSLIAVLMTSLAMIPSYNVFAQTVSSSVDVVGTCGLTFAPPTLAYGPLAIGATSLDVLLTVTNTGTVTADYTVEGTPWTADTDFFGTVPVLTGDVVMAVGATHYEVPAPVPPAVAAAYALKTPLTGAPVAFAAAVGPSASVGSLWQLSVVLSVPEYDGSASQAVTFTGTC